MSIEEPSASSFKVPTRAQLVALAKAYGVANEYWEINGAHHEVSDDTLAKVLGAMGIDVSSEESVIAQTQERQDRDWRRILPACTVVTAEQGGVVHAHVPHGNQVEVWIELGDVVTAHAHPTDASAASDTNGSTPSDAGANTSEEADENAEPAEARRIPLAQVEDLTAPRQIAGQLIGQAAFAIPAGTALGYHTLHARVTSADGQVLVGQGYLIVAPMRMADPRLAEKRSWGMMAQLYSVRSRESWGIGDLHDLAQMCATFGRDGADFVLINPLHAGEPVGHMQPSPYLPVSRRFFNPIYIRPEDIPEWERLKPEQLAEIAELAAGVKAQSVRNELIDRDAVWEAKRAALAIIFAAGRTRRRQRAFNRFRAEQGQGLADFALWCALQERNGGLLSRGLAPIDALEIAEERAALAERIEFWAWLQWILDEQLYAAQTAALQAGMRYGLCHDLAVGVHPQAADVWTARRAFAPGMQVGAPPDFYNQQGQNWSQPPWNPAALEDMAYAPLRDMVRTILHHAGALRVDHVMGLFRLYWIPKGNSAKDGAYVYYNQQAMLGIVLLEAYRAGAVLIGEDLGTVDPWIRDVLRERGVLGTSIFWFEKQDDGWPKQPEAYRGDVLATVDTHDLPPAAGYWNEAHVNLRAELNLLAQPVEEVRAEAAYERQVVVARLQEHGIIGENPSEQEIIEGIHAYVCHTPSRLIGVSLTDAVGEMRTQNQPGTDTEYPNWRIPLASREGEIVLVEDLANNPRYRSLVAVVNENLSR